MQILIVEDEPYSAEHLKSVIADCCNEAEFYPVIDSVAAARTFLESDPPIDLMFLDIHLSDGEALELFDVIPLTLPVIFTTAYDQYAVKAFEINSISYLLKPISTEKTREAMSKFETLKEAGAVASTDANQLWHLLTATKPFKENFLVPYRDKLLPIPVMDFAFFEINNGVVIATRTNHSTVVMEERSLEEIAGFIDPKYFFRANRQYIINRTAIEEVAQHINGRLSVRLHHHFQTTLLISRDKASEFKRWMSE